MRVFIVSVIFTLFCNQAFAQVHEIPLTKKEKVNNSISKSNNRLRFSFNHDKILSKTKIENDGNSYTELWLKGSYPIGEIGSPKLPAYKKLIRIPKDSYPVLKVVSYSEQLINLKEKGVIQPISPNQLSIRKDQDSSKVKFQIKKEVYSKAAFSNAPLATIEVLGNLRSATIARLTVSPIDYNPGNSLLKVYNDIEIEVSFNDLNNPDNNKEFAAKTYSPYFDVVYNSIEQTSKSSYTDHPDLTKYPTKMLIISNRMFEQSLQPFIEWKKLKGFNVKTAYTDIIGSSSDQIKTFIQQEYNSATPENPAPTFLILVGDIQQLAASATVSATGKVTDLYYASVDDDMFPDMYYGRLSATTTGQLDNIINKILYYEKYQFEDPSYLNKATLIAGVDGSWNPKVGQPTIKYATENYFNTGHGFTSINEFGITTDPNNPTANSSYSGCYDNDKISVGFINYTAHGSETSWVEPSLSTFSIASFSNTNKYPLAVGNCCLSGDFGYTECLGEAWIRAQNKGAVTYIGSSPNTYWFEDFYWAVGAFNLNGENDGYVPTYQETTTGLYDAPFVSKYVTTGAMLFAGNLAVTEVNVQGYPNQSSATYYWEAYNILGDPSLMPYFTEAETNHVLHNQTIIIGEQSFSVGALADSYIAITKDNQLIGTSYVGTNGDVSIPISPVTTPGNIVIVVTRPQTIPYIDTITAISPTGPYLALDSYSINDLLSNNNGKADYNETFSTNIKIKNIGIEDATNVKIKILGLDDNISVNSNDSISISDISHSNGINVLSVNDAFSFNVKENVPDQHTAKFTLKFYSDQGNWTSTLRILLNSPLLSLGDLKIDDSLFGGNNDSLLNPGETGKVLIRVINNGHALAKDVQFQINIPDSIKNIVSVCNIQTEPFSLDANSFSSLPFRISVNPNLNQELIVPIKLQASVFLPSGISQTFEKNIKIVSGDSVKISNDTINTCFTYFYDSGGKNRNYQNSENFITTFVAQNEYNFLKIRFTEFSVEKNYDYLYIYDGPNINFPQVNGSPFSGTNIPSEIITASRCLTVQFKSDGNTVSKGWVATIECIDPQIPNCATSPIPSDNAQLVQSGNLSWATEKYATFYDVLLGSSTDNLVLAGRVNNPLFSFKPEKNKSYYWRVIPGNYLGSNSSNCNTWHFSTDSLCNQTIMSTSTIAVDTLLFYDSGGPLFSYKNSENYTLTLIPKYAGNTLNVNFLSFNIESQSSCSYDKLSIYNGLNINSPLIGTYCGTNSPGIIQANNTAGALTFQFHSDISDYYSGWKAIVKSIGSVNFKTITLKVQSNFIPIANASVNIGGVIRTTDHDGLVSFVSPFSENVSLTTNALGYKQVSRVVTESETNAIIIVDLKKLNRVNISVSDKSSLNAIQGAKILIDGDSTFTGSSGLAKFYIPQGSYSIHYKANGYLPYNQDIILFEKDTNLNISLSPLKYQVSLTLTSTSGEKINGALISIDDTTLTTNTEGLAYGLFSKGIYKIIISKALFFPLSTWVSVKENISKSISLDAISSLYNIEFTFIGDGPKAQINLNNTDFDLYYNNILYSRFKTDTQGKGYTQLPKGNFYYNTEREGYFPISKRYFIVDGLFRQITDTLFQKTFSVKINVKSQMSTIKDATVILNGYSPIVTNSAGEAAFENIGYEKNLSYIIQRDGFLNATGLIDVINPLVLDINLISNETPVIISNHTKVFPNPVSDILTIEAEKPITRISISNTLGTIKLFNNYPMLNRVTIPTENLTPGVYIIIIYTLGSNAEKALIIKN